jgi:two-component system alkaline phosphatase synthesis response regulator PhoP
MNSKKILLVDDDPDQRLSLRLPLEAAGYQVSEAASYDEGLQAVTAFQPDLLILDVMMDSMTAGFQFALTLHDANPDGEYKEFASLPIIMLTAIHSTTHLRFGVDQDYLPVQEFLEKPVDPEVLLKTVNKFLS